MGPAGLNLCPTVEPGRVQLNLDATSASLHIGTLGGGLSAWLTHYADVVAPDTGGGALSLLESVGLAKGSSQTGSRRSLPSYPSCPVISGLETQQDGADGT